MSTRVGRRLAGLLGDGGFSEQTVFEVLRNRRRRYVLHYLKQRRERVSVGDLAEQVAAWENDTALAAVSSRSRKRVYISLVQSHLPRLAEAGMVRFDAGDASVELTDEADDVDVYVERFDKRDIRWPEYYLGLAALATVFLFAVWSDVYPLTAVPDVVWFGFVVGLFAQSAVIHHLHYRQNRLGNEGPPPE